jgi:hypothetical protein
MQTKKRFKWAGKFSDQCSGKYRVWWSSGAWTLSYGGVQISRHASSEQAKRKAAKHQKTEPSRIRTQTRHDIAASVVRHSNLSRLGIDLDLPTESRTSPSSVEADSILRAAKFDAIEYEHARDADPDPRDDEDQEIEGLILVASATLAEECVRGGETPILSARGRDKDEDRTVFAREAAQ